MRPARQVPLLAAVPGPVPPLGEAQGRVRLEARPVPGGGLQEVRGVVRPRGLQGESAREVSISISLAVLLSVEDGI